MDSRSYMAASILFFVLGLYVLARCRRTKRGIVQDELVEDAIAQTARICSTDSDTFGGMNQKKQNMDPQERQKQYPGILRDLAKAHLSLIMQEPAFSANSTEHRLCVLQAANKLLGWLKGVESQDAPIGRSVAQEQYKALRQSCETVKQMTDDDVGDYIQCLNRNPLLNLEAQLNRQMRLLQAQNQEQQREKEEKERRKKMLMDGGLDFEWFTEANQLHPEGAGKLARVLYGLRYLSDEDIIQLMKSAQLSSSPEDRPLLTLTECQHFYKLLEGVKSFSTQMRCLAKVMGGLGGFCGIVVKVWLDVHSHSTDKQVLHHFCDAKEQVILGCCLLGSVFIGLTTSKFTGVVATNCCSKFQEATKIAVTSFFYAAVAAVTAHATAHAIAGILKGSSD